MTTAPRRQTGIPQLDAALGGGLIPGAMTVVLGATGIGKTQLGLQFAHAGIEQEGEPGFVFDMTSRGDAQNHRNYARSLFDWELREFSAERNHEPQLVWDSAAARSDYIHVFRRSGRRVTIRDLEQDDWREWKIELARKLQRAIQFFYGNFIHGAKRCVIDGIEPTDQPSDSFQLQMFDYVYHQILCKESDWLARDLFRVAYRSNAERVAEHCYDHNDLATMVMLTSHEVMLDDLLARPIESGDILSNANTILLMGKVRDGDRITRALHIAKHRGSACDDRIIPFEITDRGLTVD